MRVRAGARIRACSKSSHRVPCFAKAIAARRKARNKKGRADRPTGHWQYGRCCLLQSNPSGKAANAHALCCPLAKAGSLGCGVRCDLRSWTFVALAHTCKVFEQAPSEQEPRLQARSPGHTLQPAQAHSPHTACHAPTAHGQAHAHYSHVASAPITASASGAHVGIRVGLLESGRYAPTFLGSMGFCPPALRCGVCTAFLAACLRPHRRGQGKDRHT